MGKGIGFNGIFGCALLEGGAVDQCTGHDPFDQTGVGQMADTLADVIADAYRMEEGNVMGLFLSEDSVPQVRRSGLPARHGLRRILQSAVNRNL